VNKTSVYEKLILYYQSGTGNSYRTAVWMAEAAEKAGLSVELIPIHQANPAVELKDNAKSLVGFISPTHGFIAPWSMLKFLIRLPFRRNVHAFYLATRGRLKFGRMFVPGLAAGTIWFSALILALKGYRLVGVESIDMPSNWMTLHSGQKPESIRAIIDRSKPRVDRFISRLLSGGRNWFTLRNAVELLFSIVLFPVSIGYLLFGKTFMSKIYFANRKCNSCGVCAKNCPQKAIRMVGKRNPKPFWTFHCESCMRCMGFCPQKAIEVHQPYVIIYCFFILMPFLETLNVWFAGWFPGIPVLYEIVFAGLYFLIYIAAVAAAYLLYFGLSLVPFGNTLMTWTTLTHVYRRYREPETTLHDLQKNSTTFHRSEES